MSTIKLLFTHRVRIVRLGCRCRHRRGGVRRKCRITAGVEVGETGVDSEGISSYRVRMIALWRRRVRRAWHALEEIRPESGGDVSVGQVTQVEAVHDVVWGDF